MLRHWGIHSKSGLPHTRTTIVWTRMTDSAIQPVTDDVTYSTGRERQMRILSFPQLGYAYLAPFFFLFLFTCLPGLAGTRFCLFPGTEIASITHTHIHIHTWV